MQRRQFVTGICLAGGVAVAGCLGDSVLDEGEESDTIESGEFAHWTVSVDGSAVYEYDITITNDVEVDVYFMADEEFDKWAVEESYDALDSHTDTTDAEGEIEIADGEYTLVIDNRVNAQAADYEMEYTIESD